MMTPRSFRPNLADAVLEDRSLLAYSPFVPPLLLSSFGYTALSVPPGLSANLNTLGGGALGGGGGNMGTSFYVTGFGTSSISIGNATGFAGVGGAAGSSGTGGTVTLATTVGSGAAEGGGAPPGVSRSTVAQGATSQAVLNTLYIGQTSAASGTPAGGYAGAGNRQPAPAQSQPPVPPAPPPA